MRAILRLLVDLVALVFRILFRIASLGGRLGARVAVPPAVAGASRLESTGFRRAAQGSGLWFSLGILLSAIRLLGRLGTRKREVVWSGELLPGQGIRIGHLLEDRAGRAVRPPR